MPITYPEGGTPGLLLRQRKGLKPITMNTFRVQLVPSRPAPEKKISGPEDVVALVKEMEDFDRESAVIVHLDTKNKVVGVETISIGNLNTSIVHPRETLKGALLNSSSSVIFVHNHPSGVCEPSREDLEITERLKQAFDIMGITLLDSMIVGKGCYYSLRENGYITGKAEQVTSWVAEPRTEQEIRDRVEFITAVTDYINSGADLERRKRSGEKIQASRYFSPWFDEFFYEHDRENAKKRLMSFFNANEQGIQAVNHTYYGVLSTYLNAISKPALMVRESQAGRVEVEIKYEPGKIFPYRVVYAGTDKTVQTREYPEAMAYYTEHEAERGIAEEGLTLVKREHIPSTVSENIQMTQMQKENWKWLIDLRKRSTTAQLFIQNIMTATDSHEAVSHLLRLQGYTQKTYNEQLTAFWEESQVKKGRSSPTVSENIQTAGVSTGLKEDIYLITRTVDTSRAFPIPESLIIGAAIPEKGFLFAYHVTDDPEGTMRKLKSNIPLCQINPEGDLGCGLYVSGVPEYWRGRSTAKWEFARNLNRAQHQALVTVILSDPNYRKGGGYLADFEVDYLNRDLKRFVDTGDVNLLAMTGNQPYNVHITKEIARKAGVPVPKEPGLIKVKLQGKFINAADLYSNQEIIQKAGAWIRKSKPKLFGEYTSFEINKSGINTWLASLGYCGAFTKSGFSANPEMVIWSRNAIIDAWIPEPQG